MLDQLEVSQGILFRIFQNLDDGSTIRQLLVPFSLRRDVLEDMHAGSVGGIWANPKHCRKLRTVFNGQDTNDVTHGVLLVLLVLLEKQYHLKLTLLSISLLWVAHYN